MPFTSLLAVVAHALFETYFFSPFACVASHMPDTNGKMSIERRSRNPSNERTRKACNCLCCDQLTRPLEALLSQEQEQALLQ